MRWSALAVVALLAWAVSCSPSAAFVCASDAQCENAGDGGLCEATGYCSFLDDSCESGRRYGQLAGDGLASQCTDVETGATGSDGEPAPTTAAGTDATADAGETAAVTDDGSTSNATTAVGDASSSGGASTGGETCGGSGQPCCADEPCQDGGQCIAGQCSGCGVTVGASEYSTCALVSSGRLDCWGSNNRGELGDGTTNSRYAPATVMTNVAAFDYGAYHGLVVDQDGGLWGWGLNENDQLSPDQSFEVLTPTLLEPSGATLVTGGRSHTCAMGEAGEVICWGSNSDGQLG